MCGYKAPNRWRDGVIQTNGNTATVVFNSNFRHEGSRFGLRYYGTRSRVWGKRFNPNGLYIIFLI